MIDRLRKALAIVLLLGGGAWYGIPRPKTPEQARQQALVDKRDGIIRQIEAREAAIALDERNVHQARLASFRAQHRGEEAKEEGRKLRLHAEQLREEDVLQLNRLKGKLIEAEMELRAP